MRHLVTASLALCLAATASAERPGVIVTEVAAGSALDTAGIRSGDVLRSWQRAANPPANPEGASGLLDGRSPVEIEIDGEPVARDLSHPFFWAGFQLIGDWK